MAKHGVAGAVTGKLRHLGNGPAELEEFLIERVGAEFEKALDLTGFLEDVEVPLARLAATMQEARHPHRLVDVGTIVVVEGDAPLDEAADLPALGLVLVDEGPVDAEPAGNTLGEGLARTTDDLVSARAGMAIDVTLLAHAEAERLVRKALVDGNDLVDTAARAVERRADVPNNLRVKLIERFDGVGHRLGKRLELAIDEAHGIAFRH